jgi:endonuclease YncB( thermonuclease family)
VRLFLLAIAFSCYLHAQTSELYDWKVSRVLDGDTVEVIVDFLPKELGNRLLIRIWGVDTPEKGWRAKTDNERQKGLDATEFTKQLVKDAKIIKINIISWDKFGGRVLGDLVIDGKSLRSLLLSNGYAREYYGEKKQNWD